MKNPIFKSLFLLALFILPLSQVWAGVSVTPAFVRIGKVVQQTEYIVPIEVTNTSAVKTEYFNVFVETRGTQVNGAPAATVLGWTEVTPSIITLESGEKAKINFKVTIPKGYVGDYRVFVAIMQDPSKYRSYVSKSKLSQSIGSMQFGKKSVKSAGEYKTSVNSFIKINVPIVLRAVTAEQVATINLKDVKYGQFKVIATDSQKGVMAITLPVSNMSKFDVSIGGSCAVFDAKSKRKLKVVGVNKGSITIQPKTSGKLECFFKSPLPEGSYQIRGDFLVGIKGQSGKRQKNLRDMISIDKDFAKKISSKGHGGDDRPITPILLTPAMLEQVIKGGNIRPVTIEVVNPTSQALSLSARFRSSTKNKVKATISPSRFKLAPGSRKKIKLNLSASNKKTAVFGWLSFTAKQTSGSIPASIPVMMVPDKLKLKQRLRISKSKTTLSADVKWVDISTVLQNSTKGKPALYLNAKLSLNELVSGAQVASKFMSMSKTTLLPGDKIKLVARVNFSKLKNGVYKLKISVNSEEGNIDTSKTVRVIVNRDAAEKIKVIE